MECYRTFQKALRYIKEKDYRFGVNSSLNFYNNMSDKKYLERLFPARMGKPLDLENPRTFNEKLQWLKLYDRRPEYTMMVDKVAVKQYVAEKIGGQYIIPTLGVWNDPDEIDFDALPDQFVLKCNHNSGLGMCICKDKSKLDIRKVKRELRRGLRQDYYLTGREWPYKNVPRKILAEKYMEDASGYELRDYKIHNFDGVPKFILHTQNRFSETDVTEDYFSGNWEKLDFKWPNYPHALNTPARPPELEEMLKAAKILSKHIPFVRTDFYIVGGQVYFGELTFYPASGLEKFDPASIDAQLGDWLVLPEHGGGVLLAKKNLYLWIHKEEACGNELLDYKFMCFHGKVQCSFVCSDRFSKQGVHVTFFDRDWNVMPFERHYPAVKSGFPRPQNYKKMIELAESLSYDIPFVRVDFYEINGKIYFGELTFYPGCGFEEFTPEEWDYTLGNWLILPKEFANR